jgi:putative addiction module component (TIGR02574 family)
MHQTAYATLRQLVICTFAIRKKGPLAASEARRCGCGRRGYVRGMIDTAIVEKQAMQLPDADRALLADHLVESLSCVPAALKDAWVEEVERRMLAYRQGKITAVDGPKAISTGNRCRGNAIYRARTSYRTAGRNGAGRRSPDPQRCQAAPAAKEAP